MSRNISIKIENLIANISGDPVIVCNNSDYVITFTFDRVWDAYDVKTARFVYTSGGHIRARDTVFTGNVCPVPVFTGISDVLVGVFAGDLHTTTPAKIYCRESILDYDGPPEEPDPDVYAQIMELINSGQLQGPAGEAGATYTPAVSENGELSWTNDRGLDNPEPVNIRGPQGKDGLPGPQGPPGDNTAALEAAKVAIDAAANANAAADAAGKLAPEVEKIKQDKLDKPAAPPAAAGKVLRVLSVNEDGTFTCEWADAPSSGVTDVMLYGRSIVVGGMAEIPIATGDNNQFGAMRVESNYNGISVNNNGQLSIAQAYPAHINGRNSVKPITPPILDISVKAAMCDGKGAAWTDTERIAALLRMGCTVDDNGFVKWGASE